jgi:hypothetical protein
MKQTAVEWLINELTKNGFNFKLYKKEIEKAEEMEKQQSDDYAIEFAEWCRGNYDFIKKEDYTILLKKFKKEKYENKN